MPNDGFPNNHIIRVRDRTVSVNLSELVQNNVATDTLTLDLDEDWDDLAVVVLLGPCTDATELQWSGEPIGIPAALMAEVGAIDVSVVGYDSGGTVRVVTKRASGLLRVVESGCVVGSVPEEDAPDLIGQLVAAGDAANTAASAANTAAGKASTAATKATDAAGEATDAAGEATRAAQAADAAAEAAGAAAEAARGNVLKGTLGPDPLLSADDAYATKPRRLTVYGETRQNLWVNASTSRDGITLTKNADGSLTVSGTASGTDYLGQPNNYTMRPDTTYTVSVNKGGVGQNGFLIREYDAGGTKLASHYFGGTKVANDDLSVTFRTSASLDHFSCLLSFNDGETLSGTYRIMLNEGSTAQPWCPPGLNSIDELSLVTSGKNLVNFDDILDEMIPNKHYQDRRLCPMLPVGTYTASFDAESTVDNFYAEVCCGDEVIVKTSINKSSVSSNGHVSVHFDITPTKAIERYLWIRCVRYDSPTTYTYSVKNLQLELGSTATAYEPPNVTTTPIDLDGNTLCSLPDGTCDELTIDATGAVTLVKRVGSVTLSSDAGDWKKDVAGSRYSMRISPEALDPYTPGSVISDALPYRRQWDHSYTGTHIMAVAGATYVSVGIDETAQDIADVCGGKKLLYTLATPQTIPLTSVTLPTLPSPNITVYHDSDIPSDIAVEYERDVTIAFDKLQAQVSETTVREATNG